MHISKLALAAAVGGVSLAGAAQAQSSASDPALNRFAVGVGGGTNGGSVEAAWSINRYLTLRAQGAAIDFDHDFKSSATTYAGKLRHNTVGGMLDVHPFQNALFVAGGAVTGQRKVKVDAVPAPGQIIKINGVSYTASQVLTVNGEVDLGKTAPVFGLGYDNTFTHAGRWGVRAFAGAIVGDDPKVTLTAAGPLAANPVVQANLAAEQQSLQSDTNGYRYYPVVSVGLFYRF